MGPFGVFACVNHFAPTFSENISINQKRNRLLLLKSALDIQDPNLQLVNYPWEWWHYSLGDRYAEYWKHIDAPETAEAVYNIVHLSNDYKLTTANRPKL